MTWLHAFFAVFAAFRFTTLFTSDTLWSWPRRTWPNIPWTCTLCMSVWGGALATLLFLTVPWLNWPLAFSWLYLAYITSQEKRVDDVQPQQQLPQPQDSEAIKIANTRIAILAQQRNAALDQVVYWQSEAEKFRAMIPAAVPEQTKAAE